MIVKAINHHRILAAFIITMLFTLIEAIGGWLSGSLALLADAGHMFTDTIALLISLLAIKFAKQQPTNKHTFGYLRLTTLAAFINALTLILITITIVWEALHRFVTPSIISGWTMMFIAIAGLLANILSFILLNGDDNKNINLRSAILHITGDLFGSLGAIIASFVLIYIEWLPIDPLLSILFSCLVLRNGFYLLCESLHELLEGVPRHFNIEKIKNNIAQDIPAVHNIHHIHIWQVGEYSIITMHINIIKQYNHDKLLCLIQDYLRERYHILHATIQIEYQHCENNICVIHKK